MTSDDAVPDRQQLEHAARRRTRRGWYWGVGVAAAVLLGFPVAALLTGESSLSAGETVVLFVPGVVGVVAGVFFVYWVRRRNGNPHLLVGADRGARRAVLRALRTGGTADARTDALTREAADHTVRNSWLLVFHAILLVVQLALLVHRLATSDELWAVLLSAATVACWAAALGWLVLMQKRSRRYLRTDPILVRQPS